LHRDTPNRNSSAPSADGSTDAWREELASRVDRYRAKRRRYNPDLSLRLDFESQRKANRSLVSANIVPVPPEPGQAPTDSHTQETTAAAQEIAALFVEALDQTSGVKVDAVVPSTPEATPAISQPAPKPRRPRKIIEFPRPAAHFYYLGEELAEPVVETPRILEAAPITEEKLLPAVPAITLDEAPQAQESLPGEIALAVRPAALAQRVLAAAVDAFVLGAALTLFGYVLLKISPITTIPLSLTRSRAAILAAAATAAVFWTAYHYLMLVCGTRTLGMRMAGLRISSFDGTPVKRTVRRRRVLAMLVSVLAAGLGFFWAAFDEDTLGWHDRISRTYLVSR
jgi:uncharacterized RDD family membrane protein YckC